nr:MAG TPA: hypothetical protein [Caudoviricetes sp.]
MLHYFFNILFSILIKKLINSFSINFILNFKRWINLYKSTFKFNSKLICLF